MTNIYQTRSFGVTWGHKRSNERTLRKKSCQKVTTACKRGREECVRKRVYKVMLSFEVDELIGFFEYGVLWVTFSINIPKRWCWELGDSIISQAFREKINSILFNFNPTAPAYRNIRKIKRYDYENTPLCYVVFQDIWKLRNHVTF